MQVNYGEKGKKSEITVKALVGDCEIHLQPSINISVEVAEGDGVLFQIDSKSLRTNGARLFFKSSSHFRSLRL